jgi:hypothetical protein
VVLVEVEEVAGSPEAASVVVAVSDLRGSRVASISVDNQSPTNTIATTMMITTRMMLWVEATGEAQEYLPALLAMRA